MENKQLEKGIEITINIPFTYTIGEEGYNSHTILNTVKDCKNEVLAEIENGVLNSQDIIMTIEPN